jgi:hypothetical protein
MDGFDSDGSNEDWWIGFGGMPGLKIETWGTRLPRFFKFSESAPLRGISESASQRVS